MSHCKGPFLGLTDQQLAQLTRRANALLEHMTLAEKIGQMAQFTSYQTITGPSVKADYEEDVRRGRVGSVFNAYNTKLTRRLQKLAVEQSRLGIPLLFGYDVVHGFRTVFPIPLAMACSWNLAAIESAARISAREAAAAGVHWTFAPMVDICRDPRWGRVMEGSGEDPLLGSRIAAAQVRGFQGDDLAAADTLAACVKHYAAYGAAEAGRDYNSAELSERTLRGVYLPPFKAAVDAGVASLMPSFNTVDGVPATCHGRLLRDILRQEWGFEGLVVTDYTAIMELLRHGVACDAAEAAEKAVNAGVDMDMQSGFFLEQLESLVAQGKVDRARIDEAVRHILTLKYALGLFDDPYRYCDKKREKALLLAAEHRAKARDIARQSMVLLRNDGLLPLTNNLSSLAVIGPLAEAEGDLLGPWHGDGRARDTQSIWAALKQRRPKAKLRHASGLPSDPGDPKATEKAIAKAEDAARSSAAVLLLLGESEAMSGEAASRSDIGLPAGQLALALRILATGTPTVLVTFSGRPLVLTELASRARALLHAWWPGSEGAQALVDVLFGDYEPSGRLAMTFPRSVGQIPLYYGQLPTGRPCDAEEKYTSKYLDVPNSPLFPFGFGLGYSEVSYGPPRLTENIIHSAEDTLTLGIELHNVGGRDASEVVQLYLRDPVASVSRPLRELIDFERVALAAGQRREVTFSIRLEQLGFVGSDLAWRVEPGRFELHVGPDSQRTQQVDFTYRPTTG